MRKLIIAVLISKLSLAIATETIICHGSDETYNCFRYNGGDYDSYDYPENYLSNVINVHEFNDQGSGNPDAADYDAVDRSSGDANDGQRNDSSIFIPYFSMPFIFAR